MNDQHGITVGIIACLVIFAILLLLPLTGPFTVSGLVTEDRQGNVYTIVPTPGSADQTIACATAEVTDILDRAFENRTEIRAQIRPVSPLRCGHGLLITDVEVVGDQ
jgi:hypothetical protein